MKKKSLKLHFYGISDIVFSTCYQVWTFRGDKFYVSYVRGNRGKSTVIELAGERAGLWKDFATEEGGNIIDL
uniref:hypothetical protein n=1 Tax=Wolbachia endosymbiont of Atemnus politus TaxID=2682840 RepID=UPI002105FE6F|nr:hypothetical protein [Wolbachia endosymbiont of Atemnus politus]